MTDTDAEPAVPATPAADDKYLFPASAVPRSATPMRVVIPANSNPALIALQVFGGCLLVGGFITMIVGMNRVPPRGNIFSDSAVDTITSALQFSSTNLLIELFGGVAFLIGAMALIGALTVVAVKASR